MNNKWFIMFAGICISVILLAGCNNNDQDPPPENDNNVTENGDFNDNTDNNGNNDLNDNMDLAEEFLKYLIQYALDHCMEDLQFLSKRLQEEEKNKKASERSMELIEKLKFVLENQFVRLTYTEALNILENCWDFCA